MNKHDTTHSEACRLARYAVRARQAGDTEAARRYETRALALVGQVSSAQVTEIASPRRQAPRGRVIGTVLALWAALAVMALPGVASAKPRKPSVCVDYRVAETADKRVIAVCFDGASPKVFETWTIVKLTEGAVTSTYMVGL